MTSLGGILDEYRYNAAKIRYLISNGHLSDLLDEDDDDDSDDCATLQTQDGIDVERLCNNDTTITGEKFGNLVRRHWSEIPSLGIDKDGSQSKKAADQNSEIRGSIHIDLANIRTHASNLVCNGEGDVEKYCAMMNSYQSQLILPTPEASTTECGEKMQISVPPGLRNLGATCYLNSQLQCLAQNLGFVHGLFTWRQVGADNRMSKVLTQMQSILARMKYGPQRVICTNEFATALKLENDEMQDPNEVSLQQNILYPG